MSRRTIVMEVPFREIGESLDLDELWDKALKVPVIRRKFKDLLVDSGITEGITENTIEAGLTDFLLDYLVDSFVKITIDLDTFYDEA